MGALDGLRILAIEQYGAGPFCTWHLAELGAEVIKIEDPATGGDIGRYVPPFQSGEDSLFFETFNRNKRSITLDLTSSVGRTVFNDLVRKSDAVFANVRGDVPAKLGIRFSDLERLNPRVVCCFLSGFGMTGSRRDQPGYDYLIQGMAGWMSITGEPDAPPTKSGASLVDFSAGYAAAVSLLAGIHAAFRNNRGMDCDVSLRDVALGMLAYQATWHLTKGYIAQRQARSAHPSLVPFQNFPTADGWIVIACPKDKFFKRLAGALGRPDIAENPSYGTFEARRQHREALVAIIDSELAKDTSQGWVDRLTSAGVPCAPVWTVETALADRDLEERQLIVETDHEVLGKVRALASPVRVGPSLVHQRRAPRLNEDMTYILQDVLRYSVPSIEQLEREGLFGAEAGDDV